MIKASQPITAAYTPGQTVTGIMGAPSHRVGSKGTVTKVDDDYDCLSVRWADDGKVTWIAMEYVK
jgi:hypothetical protein